MCVCVCVCVCMCACVWSQSGYNATYCLVRHAQHLQVPQNETWFCWTPRDPISTNQLQQHSQSHDNEQLDRSKRREEKRKDDVTFTSSLGEQREPCLH